MLTSLPLTLKFPDLTGLLDAHVYVIMMTFLASKYTVQMSLLKTYRSRKWIQVHR